MAVALRDPPGIALIRNMPETKICVEIPILISPSYVHQRALFPQVATAQFSRQRTFTMSWRNQGITGSNNIPLGKRRFAEEDGVTDEEPSRGRDPEPRTEADGPRRRKKRNRWGDASENKAAGLMGLPTAIMSNMTSEQLEAYTLHLRIEEISQKLRIDDVVPADGDRYVSSNCQVSIVIILIISSDRLRPLLSTITTADVSTRENTGTARSWKTSDTS